jgi:hypothetical protein
VGVEKVTVISTQSGGRSLVKGRNPFPALLDHQSRRRANHDGSFFNNVGPGRWPGQSGKELVFCQAISAS